MDTSDAYYLDMLRSQIEIFLGWEKAIHWTSRDFEELSEKVRERTGVQLSPTTLKRIWGRVRYESAPSIQTLDTLAAYTGYNNWRDFKNQNPQKRDQEKPSGKPFASSLKTTNLLGIAILGACVAVALWISASSGPETHPARESVHDSPVFFSAPVTNGIPNTVIFHYDVSCFRADSFFIQQSWDRRRRELILPENNTHTSVYFSPGYFRAKILADNQVLAEHDVYIPSDGWLALMDNFPGPLYLTLSEKEKTLSVDPVELSEAEKMINEKRHRLNYLLVQDFGELMSNEFETEAEIRLTNPFHQSVCGRINLVVICSEGRISIPFSVPGCVGDLNIIFGETIVEGKTHDFSPLGISVSQWNRLKLTVKQNQADISINGQSVYQFGI
ncbi:MAG: hypothetical protein R3C61_21860, partial [Bacteroidia bacterium]